MNGDKTLLSGVVIVLLLMFLSGRLEDWRQSIEATGPRTAVQKQLEESAAQIKIYEDSQRSILTMEREKTMMIVGVIFGIVWRTALIAGLVVASYQGYRVLKKESTLIRPNRNGLFSLIKEDLGTDALGNRMLLVHDPNRQAAPSTIYSISPGGGATAYPVRTEGDYESVREGARIQVAASLTQMPQSKLPKNTHEIVGNILPSPPSQVESAGKLPALKTIHAELQDVKRYVEDEDAANTE